MPRRSRGSVSVAQGALLALPLVASAAAPASAADFSAADYLPLQDGNYWDYLVEGTEMGRITAHESSVDEIPTWRLRGSGANVITGDEHFTRDESGLRLLQTEVEKPQFVSGESSERFSADHPRLFSSPKSLQAA